MTKSTLTLQALSWILLLGATSGLAAKPEKQRSDATGKACPSYRLETWGYEPEKKALRFLGRGPHAFRSCEPPLTFQNTNARFELRQRQQTTAKFSVPVLIDPYVPGDLLVRKPSGQVELSASRSNARVIVFRVNVPEGLKGPLDATLKTSAFGAPRTVRGMR